MLLTPDNIPGVLAGIGAILSAVGGWTLWRIRKEPPEPGTLDAVRVALAANTAAVQGQTGNFTENMRLFHQLNGTTDKILHEMEETRRATEACRDHLAAIRDAINRGKL